MMMMTDDDDDDNKLSGFQLGLTIFFAALDSWVIESFIGDGIALAGSSSPTCFLLHVVLVSFCDRRIQQVVKGD